MGERFVWRAGLGVVPKASAPPPGGVFRSRRSHLPAPYLMGDITPFVSPIDGSEITSRSQLRAHEQTHGVRQCGELKSAEDFDNTKDARSVFDGELLSKVDETAPFEWCEFKD